MCGTLPKLNKEAHKTAHFFSTYAQKLYRWLIIIKKRPD